MNRSTDVASEADPLSALRAATASRHAALDAGLPIGAPDASLHDYVAHLVLLRTWLQPLQIWLTGSADGPTFDHTPRLALIDADLAEAGIAVPGALDTDGHTWPPQASPTYRWGVHYVIEGSQLGGAVLYGRLRARLAPHRLLYLKGVAGGPGHRWGAFMQALRSNVRTQAEIAETCAGACAAFDSILKMLADSRAPKPVE
jgi:heme oxygenase